MKKTFLILTFIIFHYSFTQAQQAGSLDVSFNGTGKVLSGLQTSDFYLNKMKLGANGKIISAGCQSDRHIIVSRHNQNGTFDNTFGVNGTFISAAISGLYHVHDLIILSDNSIIILVFSENPTVGCFIVKLTSSGVLDTTFQTNGFKYFPNAYYVAIELQSNGKIVIGGQIFGNNSATDLQIIRLNSDGAYDLSFGNDGISNDGISRTDFGFDEYPTDLSIDSDGKIIMIGYSLNTHFISKYNTDGSLDNSFDSDGKLTLTQAQLLNNGTVVSMTIQNDNKIILCGPSFICRLNTNGTFDTSFDSDGIGIYSIGNLQDIKTQNDGKIVVSLLASSPATGIGAARFNSNGTLDTSFDSDGVQNAIFSPPFTGYYNAYSIAFQDDGKIIFGGVLNQQLYVVRLHGVTNFNSNIGKVPTQFTTNNDIANAIALRAGGKPIVVGNVTNAVSPTSGADFGIVAYNADGGLDYAFGSNGFASISFDADDRANAVAVQINGKILVAGKAANGSQYNLVVVRYNANGTLDNTFGIAGIATLEIDFFDSEATSIALQTDGKIVVTGLSHDQFNDGFYAILARFNANGTLDNTFGTNGVVDLPAGNGYAGKSVAIQADGKIVIACASQSSLGDFVVIRCNANGSIDTDFGIAGKVSTNVGTASSFAKSLVLQPSGKIIVCGAAKENSTDVFAMIRYTTNGSVDINFNSNVMVLTNFSPIHATANAVAIQPDGKILLTGKTTNTTNADIVLARYSADGLLDQRFNYSGKLILPFGYGNEGTNAVVSNANGVAYLAGFYHNGHDNDFTLTKIVDCMFYQNLTLMSPTENYPNISLPNTQFGNTISASNILYNLANVTYYTTESITLTPGFKVNEGAIFKTEISSCSY